jgi:hypothetical protein
MPIRELVCQPAVHFLRKGISPEACSQPGFHMPHRYAVPKGSQSARETGLSIALDENGVGHVFQQAAGDPGQEA